MNNLSFDEFVQGLKNCKDVDELLSYLSTKEAKSNYTVYIKDKTPPKIIKRVGNIDSLEDVRKREIEMGEFLTEWIRDNEGFFLDENIEYLIDLIRATHKYLVGKQVKTVFKFAKGIPHKQRLNSATKYQESVKKHLQAIKRDLEEISPKGGKTQSLLNSINEALSDMDSIVPIVKLPRANSDELRKVLTYLETNIDLPKVATRSYLKFFQSYQNSHI